MSQNNFVNLHFKIYALKRIIAFIIFLVFLQMFSAQVESKSKNDDNNQNRIYFELLGKGMFYSFNYEREIIKLNDNIGFNLSAGFSLVPGLTSLENSIDLFLPFEVNCIYSFGNHHAVLGYGTTYWSYKVNDIEIDNSNLSLQPAEPSLVPIHEWFAHMTFEYRFMKPEGGIMVKIGYNPLFFASTMNSKFTKKVNYQTSMNIGIGWAF